MIQSYWKLGLVLGCVVLPASLYARKPHSVYEDADAIQVVGRVPMQLNNAAYLTSTIHWRQNYLFIEDLQSHAVTVVDVTRPGSPAVTQQLQLPTDVPPSHVLGSVGNVALLASVDDAQLEAKTPSTVSVVRFDTASAPKTLMKLTGVLGMLSDGQRGITYVVNHDGLWILQSRPAQDKELMREYDENHAP